MKIHLIGIGGAGMSALAHLYLSRGDSVSGSDLHSSPVTDRLAASGAVIFVGHEAANVGDVDQVVTSTAIRQDNPELVEARRRGLQVVHRGAAAAQLCGGRRQVAIAGTHGKTTITSMVAWVLQPLDPLVVSGGRLPGTDFNARPGRGPVAIIEADESDGSFLELAPSIAVVTSIEADHLDRYRDLEQIFEAFELFVARTSGPLVACVDDPGAQRLLAAAAGETLSYGFTAAEVQGREYRPTNDGSMFFVSTPASSSWVRLPVPGQHNARNALAAIAVGQRLRLDLDAIVQSLAQVALPGRRLELIAEVNGARVYDDYGHHPTEVSVTLGAARELTGGRLLCAFQPHRYSRLQALLPQFATCFDEADELLLLPVYGAGEAPIPGVDSAALADAIRRRGGKLPLTLFDSLDQLPAELRRRLAPGDVAVCMGAGDIYQASARLRQPDDSGEVEAPALDTAPTAMTGGGKT